MQLQLVLALWVHVAAGFPSSGPGSRRATWDDVNVVAHGLLQLGQGLKEHVDRSKAQVRDLYGRLEELNGTVAELERRQRDGALRSAAAQAEDMRRRLEEVEERSRGFSSRMEKLEEVLTEPTLDGNHSDDATLPFIQRLMAAQTRRVDQLVEKIKQQQDKLEKQNLHLRSLQSQVAQKRVKSHRRRHDEATQRGGARRTDFARDCHHLFVRGRRRSGVYTVRPENAEPLRVLCDMTPGGGWTVIQKRHDGSQNFSRMWDDYRRGFGSLDGEFWLGLENIHVLSTQDLYLLQVELSDWSGREQVFRYQFRVDGEDAKFAVHLRGGAAAENPPGLVEDNPLGAAAVNQSGVAFSTADRDNDLLRDANCAQLLSGGWWFSSCGDSNLNGKYPRMPSELRRRHRRQRMFWTTANAQNLLHLKTTVMKIAPASARPEPV